MVFGVSYQVVGRADCPYFARAERLTQMLKQAMGGSDRDLIVESIHPDEWSAHYASLCQQYGFHSFASAQLSLNAPDHVLVFHTHTKRLVGGEKAFRKEVKHKYNIECDVSWGMLQSIARESLAKFSSRAAAKRVNVLNQPLILAVVGPPGSGSSSLARRVEKEFAGTGGGIIRISSGDLLRRVLQGQPPACLPALSNEEMNSIRLAFATGELVNHVPLEQKEGEAPEEDLVTRLIKARLLDSDIPRAAGLILDGFPRTERQAQALRDLEGSLGEVAVLFRLVSPSGSLTAEVLTERMQHRRIDPLTDEIYHTVACIPSTALVMSRLIRRLGDEFDVSSSSSSPSAQLRAYTQHIDHLCPVFKKQLRDLSADGSQQDVFLRAKGVIQPLLEKTIADKARGAEEGRKVEEERAREAALRPETPVAQAVLSINPSPAASAHASRKASPAQSPAASPVITPHTPSVESVAANVVALPLSRRSSLTRPLSASSTKGGSRRTSATAPLAVDAKSLSSSSSSSKPASASSSKPASASSSKPTSRRGSAKGSPASSPVPTPAVAPVALVAAPGSRRASLNQNRRSGVGSMRGGIPTGALNAQPAPAADSGVAARSSAASGSKPASKAGSKRSSGSAAASAVVPAVSAVAEKRDSGSKPLVPSRPISASSKRASRDAALPVAAAAAAAVATSAASAVVASSGSDELAVQELAATKIQAIHRGRMTRQEAASRKEQAEAREAAAGAETAAAAVAVRAPPPAAVASSEAEELATQELAATKIQAIHRGRMARQEAAFNKEQAEAKGAPADAEPPAAAADEGEEVVLVRKSSKRSSKRAGAASASGSTSPALASARATTPPEAVSVAASAESAAAAEEEEATDEAAAESPREEEAAEAEEQETAAEEQAEEQQEAEADAEAEEAAGEEEEAAAAGEEEEDAEGAEAEAEADGEEAEADPDAEEAEAAGQEEEEEEEEAEN